MTSDAETNAHCFVTKNVNHITNNLASQIYTACSVSGADSRKMDQAQSLLMEGGKIKYGSQTSKQLHPHYILNERKNSEEYFVIRVRRTRIFWNSRLSKVHNFSLHGYFSSKKFISLMNAVSQALCIPFTHP